MSSSLNTSMHVCDRSFTKTANFAKEAHYHFHNRKVLQSTSQPAEEQYNTKSLNDCIQLIVYINLSGIYTYGHLYQMDQTRCGSGTPVGSFQVLSDILKEKTNKSSTKGLASPKLKRSGLLDQVLPWCYHNFQVCYEFPWYETTSTFVVNCL